MKRYRRICSLLILCLLAQCSILCPVGLAQTYPVSVAVGSTITLRPSSDDRYFKSRAVTSGVWENYGARNVEITSDLRTYTMAQIKGIAPTGNSPVYVQLSYQYRENVGNSFRIINSAVVYLVSVTESGSSSGSSGEYKISAPTSTLNVDMVGGSDIQITCGVRFSDDLYLEFINTQGNTGYNIYYDGNTAWLSLYPEKIGEGACQIQLIQKTGTNKATIKDKKTIRYKAYCSHAYDSGKVTKEATTTSEGTRVYTCRYCKNTRTESIPVLKPTPTPTAKPTPTPTAKPTPTPTAKSTPAPTPKPYSNIVASGKCGQNITWELDKNDKLTLAGRGTMGDYLQGFARELRDGVKQLVVSENITSIGEYTFAFFRNLETVSLPGTLTDIGEGAFCYCSSLRRISIPRGVTAIKDGTFCGCDLLEEVSIPNGVTSIGDHAFFSCESLCEINLPGSITSIGEEAFYGCCLQAVNLPSALKRLGKEALHGCSLRSVTIPNGIKTLEEGVFAANFKLEAVGIPEGVTQISCKAFDSCMNLRSVSIPRSVTSIASDAFDDYYLKNITGYAGSRAESYAAEKGYQFISIDGGASVPTPTPKPAASKTGVKINAQNFPDDTFRTWIQKHFDRDGSGILADSDAGKIECIIVISGASDRPRDDLFEVEYGVTSFKGIEFFPNLEYLYVYERNDRISGIDVSRNKKLRELCCISSGLKRIDITNCPGLQAAFDHGNDLWYYDGGATVGFANYKNEDTSYICIDTGTELIANGKAMDWGGQPSQPASIEATIASSRSVAGKTLTHTGQPQPLVTAGSVDGGVLYYALGTDSANPPAGWSDNPPASNWSSEVPTGTDAGTYYVWYMVKGDANHNDVAPACVAVTITAPAETTGESSTPTAVAPAPAPVQPAITIPKVPASVKAKAAKKGKVTVSWKNIKKTKKTKALLAQIKGIEVQYSTDPTFATNVVTKSVGKKKTKVTLKLQKKTVYYIRVRYTDGAGGVSNWSKVRKLKTKK